MSAVLYDPIAQNNAQGQVRSNTWPPVWHKVLEVMYSGILANNARPHPEYRRGDPLDAPLFFTRTFVIPTTNDWVTICRALYNIVLQDDIRGPYTQRLIPRLIQWLRTTVPETRGQQHCNDNLRRTLEHHMDTVALPNISSREITDARSRSHYSNWTWGRLDTQAPQHSFELWGDMKATRAFLLMDPEILKIPQFTIPDAALAPKNNKERPSWQMIQRMRAPPSVRSTIRRLCLNRMPDRREPGCQCGESNETIAHTLSCPDFARIRNLFFPIWMSIAHKIVSAVSNEADNGRPPAYFRSRLPRHAPRLDNWLALPFICWQAFLGISSESARAFLDCFQLAAALIVHLHWVARNDSAYSFTNWNTRRMAMQFNELYLRYAHAYIPPQSPISQFLLSATYIIHDAALPSGAEDNSQRSRNPP
ncbi:hypothetical protein COEREDRAFT_12586 [Coemansia reversa NRRL 1564]|uniref:Uncharacterized protein n=1 Tax=Coemansia reversa (strain ATCC 12441 / NRRL 1564) TaxID=763665 RepID=A0A2G5B0M5_COERN|nr:hypothetical protein COEREDRAFT_12586 [Coemansia reversa NRRL 1564]|eukprot:PIA12571.1 hypothetical protein COEREDRAFT_12586 [Coemansia reversa NRRL 1564]